MRSLLRSAVAAAILAFATPAAVLAADDERRSPEDLVVEGMDKMKQALDELLRSLPRFEAPIITDDGDIIIRRAPPFDPAPRPEWPPERDEGFGGIET